MFGEFTGSPHPSFDDIRGRAAVFVEDPTTPIRVLEWGQTHRSIEISSPVQGTLMWRVLAFPDMRVRVDGMESPIAVDHTTGLVTHVLPAGSHVVEWRWRPFPVLRWARGVSLVSLVVSAALLLMAGMRRRRYAGLASNTTEAG